MSWLGVFHGGRIGVMVVPRGLARFNRHVTNPVLGTLVPHVPGFAMIVHVGRKSGKTYHTPVNLFRTGDGGYLVALTYGRNADWVRNVIAHDGCEALIRNRPVRLARPRVIHDPQRRAVPAPARFILGLVGVEDFLELHADSGDST